MMNLIIKLAFTLQKGKYKLYEQALKGNSPFIYSIPFTLKSKFDLVGINFKSLFKSMNMRVKRTNDE